MPARSRAGRPPIIQLGATASTLKTYVLIATTVGAHQRRPLSEYAAPLRFGPPDYDARQVASTTAFPDFAGGAGKYLPDSRQEANRYWYSSLDTRWQGIISLPPKFTASTLPSQPTANSEGVSNVYSDVNSTNLHYMAVGDRLYSLSGTTWSNVIQHAAGAHTTYRLRRIIINPSGTLTEYLFWMRSDNTYRCSGDPTVGGNWSAETIIVTDLADVYQSPLDARAFVGMLVTGSIYTDDLITETQVGAIRKAGHFLGIMGNVLYMVDGSGGLWAYDPTRSSGTQVYAQPDAGVGIVGGVPWQNSQLALTDSRRVSLFHPTRPSRDITPGSPDGLPASQVMTIRGLFTVGERLLLYGEMPSTTVQLWEYKGGGWHILSQAKAGTWPGDTATDLRRQTDSGFGFDVAGQRHILSLVSAGTFTTYLNALPSGGDCPFVQELLTTGDGFEASGIVETGWHYLGLRGLSGPLLQVRLLGEMPNTNVSIVVKYKINFDESSWTTLGTLTSTTRTLTFASGAGTEFRTVKFYLELATTGGGGGGTSAVSPNGTFSIDFLKVPEQLSGHIFTVDIEATRRRSRRTANTIYNDLLTLAEQKTLPVIQFEDQTSPTYVKLEAPRETSYVGPDGKKYGAYTIVANEVL